MRSGERFPTASTCFEMVRRSNNLAKRAVSLEHGKWCGGDCLWPAFVLMWVVVFWLIREDRKASRASK
jgi:hypothetical protein